MESRNGRNIGERSVDPFQGEINRFKIVMLGKMDVGKTALSVRFIENQFSECTDATIGAQFQTHTFSIETQVVRFELWDTSGQERFSALIPLYYRGARGAIVVYDVQSRESFEFAKNSVRKMKEGVTNDIAIVLVGNKTDREELRIVNSREAEKYARENNLSFVETSAKTGQNVAKVFMVLAQKLLNECNSRRRTPIGSFRITEGNEPPKLWCKGWYC